MKRFLKWEVDSRCNRVLRDRGASQTEKDGTMRFHFETMPLTGMTDVISIQTIGMSGDNRFVIEAETEDEAREKLLDLLEKRVWQGWVRPATEDEAKEFEEWQDDAKKHDEWAAQLIKEFGSKGSGNEQAT
jgi:SRSO17 transposase